MPCGPSAARNSRAVLATLGAYRQGGGPALRYPPEMSGRRGRAVTGRYRPARLAGRRSPPGNGRDLPGAGFWRADVVTLPTARLSLRGIQKLLFVMNVSSWRRAPPRHGAISVRQQARDLVRKDLARNLPGNYQGHGLASVQKPDKT